MVNEAGEKGLHHIMLSSLDFVYPTGHWVPLMNFKKGCGMIRFAFQKGHGRGIEWNCERLKAGDW